MSSACAAPCAWSTRSPASAPPVCGSFSTRASTSTRWGRIYNDDVLFGKGLSAIDKAIALAPGGRLVVDDANLQMRSADELRAELQRGITRDASDFNPLRVFGTRK